MLTTTRTPHTAWQAIAVAARPACASLLLCTIALLVASPRAAAQEIKLGGTGAGLGTMQVLAAAYTKTHPQTSITVVPSMGSGGGIKALLAGALDLAVSSRALNASENKAGVEAVEYGRTPLVFATATSNKTQGVSTQFLVDAYSGKIDTWPDGHKLRLVMRPLGDSDSETVKSLSPALREAKTASEKRQGMVFSTSDQDTANTIEKVPGALGPSTLALMLSENRALKALALNGVMPTVQTLASGAYPLAKPLLLVSGPGTSAQARDFVAFVRSPAGRELLAKHGHWVK